VSAVAELVADYRAKLAAEPTLYGEIDAAMWLVEDTPERTWTPSEVGKALRITTVTAGDFLRELYLDGYIASDERGAWTRYRARSAR